MRLIKRSAWRAQYGRGPTNITPTGGVAVHYVGAGTLTGVSHSRCDNRVRAIERWHVEGNGWAAIAYNWLVCEHGYVFQGRGLHHRSAAQGTADGNQRYYAVCALIGSRDTPGDALKAAIRDVIDHCQAHGAGPRVRGHRDFRQTSCPGDPLYRWIRAGARRPAAREDDDMPTYVSIDKTDQSRREGLTAGTWQQIYFDQNNSRGTQGHHADGDWPSLVRGPADYTGDITLRLSGVPAGVPVQARVVEVDENSDSWEVVETSYPIEHAGTAGDTYVTVPCTGHVSKDRRLRIEVTHYGGPEITPKVTGGQVRLQVWER